MHLIHTGLNHKTAPVDVRERCAFSKKKMLLDILGELKNTADIDGAVLLVTCNRTELYATAQDPSEGRSVLENILQSRSGIERSQFKQYLYTSSDHNTVSHLFSVASGLDSMVLGEQEILGQIKEAYQLALEAGATSGILNIFFQKAIHAGKRVRTETGINNYPVSVSSAAVELCREIFGTLENRSVLILGAGDMSELAVKHLAAHGIKSVIVSNRSYDQAVAMARSVNGKAIQFRSMPAELEHTDILFSCTAAPHYVVRQDNCKKPLSKRKGRDIVMIDIAVPRNIEPAVGTLPNVFLYDIDDLQNVVDKNYKERLKAAHEARKIIDRETLQFTERLAAFSLVPVILSLNEYAESVKKLELKKALKKLNGISKRDEKIVRSLAHAIVNKIMHAPVTKLKEKAVDDDQGPVYARVVKDLFDLDIEE